MVEKIANCEIDYKTLLDSVPDFVIVYDMAGHLIEVNEITCHLLGYNREDLLKLSLHEIEEGGSTKWFAERIRLIKEVGYQRAESSIIRKDGTAIPIEMISRLVEFGSMSYVLSVARDFSKLKGMEPTASDEKDRTEKLLDLAHATIVMLLPDGKVGAMNKKGCDLLGYEKDEIVGQDWFDVVVPARMHAEMKEVFAALMAGATEHIDLYRTLLKLKSGEERVVSWHNALIRGNDGKPVGVIGSGVDITNYIRAEEELGNAVRGAQLYFDFMSHDIKNHLQEILLLAEILQISADDPNLSSLADEIVGSVMSSRALILKVHATERLLKVPTVEFSLKRTLEACLEEFSERYSNVELDVDYQVDEALIRANSYLKVLINNILENAVIHNMSEKKHIWVRLYEISAGFELAIADNGLGINDEAKGVFFNPMSRLKGVGAHQAKQIAERFRGRIMVLDRVPGKYEEGVEFRIWFPASETQ